MDVLRIDNEKIPRGTNAELELFIARLPSGTKIHMPVNIFRSKFDGPVVLLSGGLHGDEVNGIEIVRRLIDLHIFERLLCGTVIALPIINIYGFINFSREVPDGKDVNRSFPGSDSGSLAGLVAHNLCTRVLPPVEVGLDFHTGGASRTNYPQVRFAPEDKRSEKIAQAFAPPFLLHSPMIPNSLREQMWNLGKAMIVYEGGESLRLDEYAIEEGIRGVQRVLKFLGMCKTAPKPRESRLFTRSYWIRANTSGLFRLKRHSGQRVLPGESIGVIHGPTNRYEEVVEADQEGYIIGHNNVPVVHKGDALFHIGLE
ncbi:MAG: succinylglutamate desuccinylase/aspartoacylase family protein [Microscillaceae bacterium]|nr:succinylglutamate desuccinylase/aspartoacylase family protein [Microscillaceae bacterium]